MIESTDILVSGATVFFSAGLLTYWGSRALLLLRVTREELDQVLQDDLWWGRRAWHTLRAIFFPSSNLLSL